MKLRYWLSSTAIGALAVAGSAAWADPPERVGRVAFIRGDVSIQPTQKDDWSPVGRNYPVTQDEGFWTERNSNAELQIGPIEVFLDGETEFDIDQLDYGVTQFSLPEGAVHIEMARVPEGGVRIETPQGEVRLTAAGAYRIDAGAADNNNPDSLLVTVLSGHAEVAGPGVLVPIERGQMATVDNGYRVSINAGGGNDLDDFARRQLQAERYNDQPIYVSDEYTGYEDLNAYGDWDDTPDYGRVWYPRGVGADWAPYHYGHWAHVAPWGWTWIDDAQWGFTPFHYGRWTQIRGRWCWAPGERAARPVYAPALVSFIGGGPGVGIGISVGWVPLAPREIYRPYYNVSTTYVRNINITNVDRRVVSTLTVENIRRSQDNFKYHNDHARTFVRQDDFARAAPVQRAAIKGGPPPQAGGRGPQPFDISQVRATPQARAGVGAGVAAGAADHGGGPPRGHAPRFDKRPIVMKPPVAAAVPHTPTAPIAGPGGRPGQPGGQPGGRSDFQRGGQPRADTTLQQGAPPKAGPPVNAQQAPVATDQDRRGPPGRNGRNFGRDNPGNANTNTGVGNPAAVSPAGGNPASVAPKPGNPGVGNGGGQDNGNRFQRAPVNNTPTPPPAPQAQVQQPPQVQAQQPDRRFEGRRPGQPNGGQSNAAPASDRGSPGDAGGRFGRRDGPPQGGNPSPAPQVQTQAPAHVAAPPPPQPQAQQQPPHPQGGDGGHRGAQGGGQPKGQPQDGHDDGKDRRKHDDNRR